MGAAHYSACSLNRHGSRPPQRRSLRVGDRQIDTGEEGGSSSLALTVPAGEEEIAIDLTHGGGSRLSLPPLRFRARLGEGDPDPSP